MTTVNMIIVLCSIAVLLFCVCYTLITIRDKVDELDAIKFYVWALYNRCDPPHLTTEKINEMWEDIKRYEARKEELKCSTNRK